MVIGWSAEHEKMEASTMIPDFGWLVGMAKMEATVIDGSNKGLQLRV